MDTTAVKKGKSHEDKKRKAYDSPRKTKRFISVEMFDKMIVKPSIEWNDLSLECIYKVDNVYDLDERRIADLTNREGITVPVALPEFVTKKLSLVEEKNKLAHVVDATTSRIILAKAIEHPDEIDITIADATGAYLMAPYILKEN